MKELRIVFMGTPDFAVGVLRKLVENGRNVVGVITAPDRPAGRGRKLKASAVKEYAISENLAVLQPTNLKHPDFLETLKGLDGNLQIVVAFRMLPKLVWDMPKYGTFNLHASLLPQYRGAAPINWAIINGETKTGVTTFFIDDKIDTGAIIQKKEIEIEPKETAGSLHDKLMILGGDLVLETISAIETNEVETFPQPNDNTLREAPKLTGDNTKIDWNKPVSQIDAFIRGLSPYPVAWSELIDNDKSFKVKIYASEYALEEHSLITGKIYSTRKECKVACSDGYLYIKEIQFPGKKKMDIKSLLNGYSFSSDAKMM